MFKTLAPRCTDMALVENVADEILGPLRTGKLASADHRVLHADMLMSLRLNANIADKICTATATVAAKEGNEAALSA